MAKCHSTFTGERTSLKYTSHVAWKVARALSCIAPDGSQYHEAGAILELVSCAAQFLGFQVSIVKCLSFSFQAP